MGRKKGQEPERIERKLLLDPNALEDLEWLAANEPKALKKALELIKHVLREPHTGGLGKPEPLKGFPNTWSRRVSQGHRLVYVVFNDRIQVLSCRYHYGDD